MTQIVSPKKPAKPRATKPKAVAKPKTSLVLRSCRADMLSTNDFVWPGVGEVATAPDWDSTPACGHGLHGWLYGQGDHDVSNYLDETSKWLVVEVESASIIMLGGKCKFPSGTVRFIGTRQGAAAFLIANEPQAAGCAVIGAVLTVGENRAVIVGAFGTATAGAGGTATAGYIGTATAGDSGTATAGAGGTATAGDSGTATAGDSGTATAGDSGTATAGAGGTISIRYWDAKNSRYRIKSADVGENGIEPCIAYVLNDKAQFVAKGAK